MSGIYGRFLLQRDGIPVCIHADANSTIEFRAADAVRVYALPNGFHPDDPDPNSEAGWLVPALFPFRASGAVFVHSATIGGEPVQISTIIAWSR